jgi:parallel beta-helix repeat protein
MKKILTLLIILAFLVSTNLPFASSWSLQPPRSTIKPINEAISSPSNLNWWQDRNTSIEDRNSQAISHSLQSQAPSASAKPDGIMIKSQPEPSTKVFEITKPQTSYMITESAHLTGAVTSLKTQVPYWQQYMSNWCWAASLAMLHQWWSPTLLGTGYQQESEIVQYIEGTIVNEAASADDILRVVKEWDLMNSAYFSFQSVYKGPGKLFSSDPPTGYADDPKTWIDYLESPVIAFVDTDVPMDGRANHAVLIVGYDDTLNGGSVFIHDPLFNNWWPGHSGQPNYELALTYSEFNDRWDSLYEGIWPINDKYHGMVAGIPGDLQYVHSSVALNDLPTEVDFGYTYEVQLALTEDGNDAGSSRYSWAQGVFLRLYGAELVSASSGGFMSYQTYDESGNSVPIAGAKIIEFYSDFTLRSATIYAYATIRVTNNVVAKYRGWITDEDDMTHCSVHTQTIDDDRPYLLTMNNAELVIDRKPNDIQNDRSNFLDYPTFEKQASLRGLATSTISVSVNPSQINLGGGTTISGTISSSTLGDLSGIVFMQYSSDDVNWYDIGTTTSTSSGSFSYWWTPSSTGTFYVRSYWNGNANYAGATSNSVTLMVISGAGNLGDHTMCKGVDASGNPVIRTNTFYTDDTAAYSWVVFLDIYSPSHTIHWYWYDPDGAFIGDYTWTIPDPGSGYYYPSYWASSYLNINGYQAWYATRLGRPFQTKVYYDGSLVVTETWQVIKHDSSISVSLSSTSTMYSQSLTVSSQISSSFSDGTTTLQYSTDGTNWNNIASGTPSNGYYSNTWTPPAATSYYIRATWGGNLNYYGSTSPAQTLIVNRAATTLATTLTATTINNGESVTITASMMPQLLGKLVQVQYSLDDANWYFLSSGTTNLNGQYAYSWTPATGTYYLRSTWAGDDNYDGATSSSQTLVVVVALRVHNLDTGLSYATIQTAIDAAETLEEQRIFVEHGIYYECLVIHKSLSLRGEDRTTTIIDGGHSGHVIEVLAHNVSITGFTIRNSAEYKSGIRVAEGSANVNISCNIITNNSDGIYFDGSGHSIVSGNYISTNPNGIMGGGLTWSIISENTMVSSTVHAIELESANHNILFGNNVTSSKYGIFLGQASKNNIITGNNVANNYYGIYLEVSSSNDILGNNITGNAEYGIYLRDFGGFEVYNNTISGNNIENNLLGIGANEDESSEVFSLNVSRNNIINNYGIGIYFFVSLHSNITENNISGNSGCGIFLSDSSNNFVFRNNLTRNYGQGIRLCSSSNNTVMENTVIENDYAGIILEYSSDNNLSGNNVTSNQYGIELDTSSNNNIVSGNNIINNHSYGIVVEYSSNFIYHNNFIDNANQFATTPSMNVWDDGYPSGGNYWSDYSGADSCSGPYQNETGSDGIGDTPYVTDTSDQDNYPLMKPYSGLFDIGITNITTSKTVVGQSYNLSISVKIINYGINTENFNVTAYANTTIIQTKTLTLAGRNSTIITFAWNTTDFVKGNYTIWAYAWPVEGETATSDNLLEDGWVLVSIPGDVNGDRKVDLKDVYAVAKAYGSIRGSDGQYWHQPPRICCPHSPNCDIDDDGKIDLKDYYTVTKNYGKTW